METPSQVPVPSARHPRSFTVPFLVGFFLVLVGVFAWRIFHYVRMVESGKGSQTAQSFARDMSISRTASTFSRPSTEVPATLLVDKKSPSLGNPSAPLTIVEFADFSCPYSRQVSFLLRSLAYENADNLFYVYRFFPLADLRPEATILSEAAVCAQEQGKFWEYHDKLYQNATTVTEDNLLAYAGQLGLEKTRFAACLRSGAASQRVQADYEAGLAAGVYGTPTFFLNGHRIEGAIPADILRTLVAKILAQDAGE
ncbi:MAG TPA: DsbA family protein [Patescibacteria group bacterium]|nr:DsbA family protein [Patescibacteria group bacterium]